MASISSYNHVIVVNAPAAAFTEIDFGTNRELDGHVTSIPKKETPSNISLTHTYAPQQ